MDLLQDRSIGEGPNELIRYLTRKSMYHEMVSWQSLRSIEWQQRKRESSARKEHNSEGRRWDVAGSTNSVEGSSQRLVSF